MYAPPTQQTAGNVARPDPSAPSEDPTALSEQVVELLQQGRYFEAFPLTRQLLAIQEQTRGPDRPDVATALYNLAYVYARLARYSEAEPLFRRSLEIRENVLGPDHLDIADTLHDLATLYMNEARYAEAEVLYSRSLAISEKALGPNHPDVALALNNLAVLYVSQARFNDAESLLKRALGIREQVLGPNHPDVALSVASLAYLYLREGHFLDAGSLLKRVVAIQEKALDPDHPDVSRLLHVVAQLYQFQGRYAEADASLERVLAIDEKTLGPTHPYVAATLNDLAGLRQTQARYAEAEQLYDRAFAIKEKALGSDHPDVAISLQNIASLRQTQGHYAQAEPLLQRALAIQENALGPDHPDVAAVLSALASLYDAEGRYADTEPLLKRALAVRENALGPDHPDVAETLNGLARVHQLQGRYAEAYQLYKRALAIEEKAFGPDHPEVASRLKGIALGLASEGRYAEAEPLLKRALAIQEKAAGYNHPNVAAVLNDLGDVCLFQSRFADAEPLYQRALTIEENTLGPDSIAIARSLRGLVLLYISQARYAEAEPLSKRSLAISKNVLGPEHPDVAVSIKTLAWVYIYQGRYADALSLVRTAARMGFAEKLDYLPDLTRSIRSTYLLALMGAARDSLISQADAFVEGYQVIQHATPTAASKALGQLAVRFAAGEDQLAQLVRRDQDFSIESDRLDKLIIESASKEPFKRNAVNEQHIRDRLRAIASERSKLEATLSQEFPRYAALAKPESLSVQQTQRLLADDEALIVFDFDWRSYAWVFTQSSANVFVLKIAAKDLEAQITPLRSSLEFEPATFDLDASYRLYQSIFRPFADYISSKKRLSVVMNGALTSFPLQLLVTSDPAGKALKDVDWLVRKYAITVLPSTASLKILREGKVPTTATKPMIGFGDPVFHMTAQTATGQKLTSLNRSLPEFYRGVTADMKSLAEALVPLPETAYEIQAVAKELGAEPEDMKLGEAASVITVKHTQLTDYHVVYFATHALVAGEVEQFAKVKAEPALVLSIPDNPTEDDDGLLRASDVAMLKMNADFVVLSACNTAAGDKPGAEALSGLASAFFYAGARSLIVSNWEVDSEATVALMTGLFDALRKEPHLSHAEALRLSMLQMLDNPSNPKWAQPYYWAPFMVVGEPQKN